MGTVAGIGGVIDPDSEHIDHCLTEPLCEAVEQFDKDRIVWGGNNREMECGIRVD